MSWEPDHNKDAWFLRDVAALIEILFTSGWIICKNPTAQVVNLGWKYNLKPGFLSFTDSKDVNRLSINFYFFIFFVEN